MEPPAEPEAPDTPVWSPPEQTEEATTHQPTEPVAFNASGEPKGEEADASDATEAETKADEKGRPGIIGRILGVDAGKEDLADSDSEGVGDTHTEPAADEQPAAAGSASASSPDEPSEPVSGETIDVNRATFEDLRDLGFSVTQATRVITYREQLSGFKTLDDLAAVPGMPRSFLSEISPRLTVS